MYNWIETTFNVSGGITQAIAVILALAVVLLLFGLFIFILKRLMGASAPQSRNRQPRIAIMDSATVDARRRLLLIRRDNIEHLILVGGPSDVVVEQNIIRNTPLTQARPGHHTPAPSGMAMPVKAALAPGPEIPARPDELLPDEEVAAPAVQARMPVQSPEPAPQPFTPAPQPTASVSAAPAPTAPASTPAAPAYKAPPAAAATPAAPISPPAAPTRSYAEPTVARPMAARAVETAPAPSAAAAAPSSAQQPTAPKASPAASQVASPAVSATGGGGLSRASDLLRAATQNGFNKAMPKPADPVPPVQEVQAPQSAGEPKVDITATLETDIQPSEPAAATAKAPEVRPAVSAASAPQESRAASTLKSLARPFTARDRPSYGGTISPPASGPAARAKTALLKPVEPLQADHKVEPVLAAATVAVASPQLAEESKAPSEEKTPAPDQSAFAAPQPEEPADANDRMASAQQASDALSLTEEAESGETRVDTEEDTAQTAAPTVEDGASSEAQSAEEDGPAREISLDIGDLLEDVPEPSTPAPAPTSAQTPEQAAPSAQAQAQAETSGTPEPQSDEPSAETSEAPQEKTATATVTSTATVAPAAPVSSTPVTTSAPPVKAPVRPSAGLGDRNPIEEEMAKILDELGGQSNG